jgi:periplasmic protein TonB
VTRVAEVNGIRLPFALSLLGHAILLALLVRFVTAAPPLPLPTPTAGIAVTFAPAAPPAPAPPPPKPPPPAPPPVAAITPPPSPPLPSPTPEAPTVEEAPLPPEKPVVPPLRRVERRIPRRVSVPVSPPTPPVAAPQPAPQAVAARVPAPPAAISPGYIALLQAWLDRHKRYPETARERGEEGRAVLQFTVDRSGRVLDFAVVKSSGYPDLDAAIDGMMQGATLPPFPDDMPQLTFKFTVPVHFSLEQ